MSDPRPLRAYSLTFRSGADSHTIEATARSICEAKNSAWGVLEAWIRQDPARPTVGWSLVRVEGGLVIP